MKNIHVLPTDKPSRLYYTISMNGYVLHLSEAPKIKSSQLRPQHIYITSSDEEIKEGDYYLPFSKSIVKKTTKYGEIEKSKTSMDFSLDYLKKIILTTDQDLIKDGIQAIDDEFLEWIVKNPSCEEVEVKSETLYEHKDTYRPYPSDCKNLTKTKINYFISTIPKEEPTIKCDICKMYPRLEGTNKCESCYSVVRHVLEQDPRFKDNLLPDVRKPKQETLEEAAENYAIDKQNENASKYYMALESFQEGVKWQAERSYSEEEIISFIHKFLKEHQPQLPYLIGGINMWFEHFKKK